MENEQLINPFGGNLIIVAEIVKTAGVWTLVTPVENSTCFELGHLHKEGYSSGTSKTQIPNTLGNTAYSRFDKNPVITGIMMERGVTKREYLNYGVIGKFHLLYMYENILNGQWIEQLAIGQITPQDENSFPDGATTYPFEFSKIAMGVDTVISAQNITDIEACFTPDQIIRMAGPASILKGRYEKVTATSVT